MGGGFEVPEETMSAQETEFWQDQAALLDPDAYALVIGSSQTLTVAAGEHYYVLWAWFVQATGGGTSYFHRRGKVDEPMILPEGRALTTSATDSNSLIYYCRPSLVTGSGAYQTDPRGLYFERIMRLGELEQFTIGVVITNNAVVTATFPTDFTDGLMIHTSTHDLAWLGLQHSAGSAVITGQDEISDTDRVRFAHTTILPFTRTLWPKIAGRGASQSEGRGTITYVKLPGDW